jgi:hypothetical protein
MMMKEKDAFLLYWCGYWCSFSGFRSMFVSHHVTWAVRAGTDEKRGLEENKGSGAWGTGASEPAPPKSVRWPGIEPGSTAGRQLC